MIIVFLAIVIGVAAWAVFWFDFKDDHHFWLNGFERQSLLNKKRTEASQRIFDTKVNQEKDNEPSQDS